MGRRDLTQSVSVIFPPKKKESLSSLGSFDDGCRPTVDEAPGPIHSNRRDGPRAMTVSYSTMPPTSFFGAPLSSLPKRSDDEPASNSTIPRSRSASEPTTGTSASPDPFRYQGKNQGRSFTRPVGNQPGESRRCHFRSAELMRAIDQRPGDQWVCNGEPSSQSPALDLPSFESRELTSPPSPVSCSSSIDFSHSSRSTRSSSFSSSTSIASSSFRSSTCPLAHSGDFSACPGPCVVVPRTPSRSSRSSIAYDFASEPQSLDEVLSLSSSFSDHNGDDPAGFINLDSGLPSYHPETNPGLRMLEDEDWECEKEGIPLEGGLHLQRGQNSGKLPKEWDMDFSPSLRYKELPTMPEVISPKSKLVELPTM